MRTLRQRARPRIIDVKAREFEQASPSSKDRVEVNSNAELEETSKLLKAKLEQLENEIAILKAGPFSPNSDFMRSLPSEDRETALKALKDAEESGQLEKGDDQEWVDEAELDRMVEGTEDHVEKEEHETVASPRVTLRIPKLQMAYVNNFNAAIADAAKEEGGQAESLVLWKWYLRCQKHVLGFLSLIPEDVWPILWQSQEANVSRSKNLATLANDMIALEVPLSGRQWITYIECLRDIGDMASAVSVWEKRRDELGHDAEFASSFWPLGVQLYAEIGRPRKAQDIAIHCLDHGSLVEPQTLVHVISAWARSQDPNASQKAWTCYLLLRERLGEKIVPEDFEEVSNSLLRTGKADLALAVFKDMLLTQEYSSADSQAVYSKELEGIIDLQSKAVSEDAVNRISLAALTILPRSFQNRFFYGSWIKKLIGQDEIDAAASVMELMYERGINPDARHLNGIIGAWLRHGSSSAKEKAEKMAWSMIHARIAFVKKRQNDKVVPFKPLTEESRPEQVPIHLRRKVPSANIETFSILLLHYTRRSRDQVAEHLTATMVGPAMISPNSFIMNHWLYAALRVSNVQGVWDKYVILTNDIRPDLETFACLWDTGKVQYDQSKAAYGPNFPSARKLYAEMKRWLDTLDPNKLKRSKEVFTRDLYEQIIRCFCLSSDLKGTLCALRGLKDIFNVYPDADTTRMLVIQVARLLPADPAHLPSGRRGMRRRISKSSQAVSEIASLLERLAGRRNVEMISDGLNPEAMGEGESDQLQLDVVTEFLVVVFKQLKVAQRQSSAAADVEREFRMVAENMGVSLDRVNFTSEDLAD